jgi:hypothetical protein
MTARRKGQTAMAEGVNNNAKNAYQIGRRQGRDRAMKIQKIVLLHIVIYFYTRHRLERHIKKLLFQAKYHSIVA